MACSTEGVGVEGVAVVDFGFLVGVVGAALLRREYVLYRVDSSVGEKLMRKPAF